MGATAEPDETMNSRLSWSVDGIDPSIRERAEAAARRAGMSFNEWIDSNLGDTPPNFRHSKPPSRDVADILCVAYVAKLRGETKYGREDSDARIR